MTHSSRDRERLQELLDGTSRTFALAIPQLPEPRATEVTVAYLLFRIADTFEDATAWDFRKRNAALAELAHLLDAPDARRAASCARRWCDGAPVEHDGYLALLEQTPFVLAQLGKLQADAARIVAHHTIRTCRGMSGFLERARDATVLRLGSLEDLRAYCYAVAGIVGEMLTELFLLEGDAVRSIAARLRKRAAAFGEALQLVNVLRDSTADRKEGRSLVPDSVPRTRLLALARSDLRLAAEYTLSLQEAGARTGIVAFTALPILLAAATLDAVERDGPGSKISRARVWRIVARMKADLRLDRPVVRLERPAFATGAA